MKYPVRVRFAPSPTGTLHLGGARTALFNYLYAAKHKGCFHLRIEDTDVKRSKQEYVDEIRDSLRWLGLNWDGPIVFQSERKTNHRYAVRQLLKADKAYRCFCTVEELKKERENAIKSGMGYQYSGKCLDLTLSQIKLKINGAEPFCVRLKIPRGMIKFTDLIYGKISVMNKEIDDFIIQRSDGNPTYNLTVVVDDSDMEITHVIRGEDHLTNTPKQILIYKMLGKRIPKFAHLPMILGPDMKRLSKRHGASGVQEFHRQGYLPQALLNYLALLGWNPDTDQEIFTVDELINNFRIEQVQKKAAVFDEKKLLWVSGQHMAQSSSKELFDRIRRLNLDWQIDTDKDYLLRIIDIQKKRIKKLSEIITQSDFFFEDPGTYDPKTAKKRWRDETINKLIRGYIHRLSQLEEWTEKTLESELRELAEEMNVGASKLIHATRLAITGIPHGPSLFLLMELLGKAICLRRLKVALERLPLLLDSDEEGVGS